MYRLYDCKAGTKNVSVLINRIGDNVKHINTVAEILKVIGVFILVIGTIASICVGCISKEFSFVLFFVMEIEVFIGGIIFIGFSEIIKLLQDIKDKMK